MPRASRLPRSLPSFARDGGWAAVAAWGLLGKGLTAKDAQAAAGLSRFKDLTQVIYFPIEESEPLALPPLFERVRQALPDPSRVWLVGGSVRDALLRRDLYDLDFVTLDDGLALARSVAEQVGGAFYPLDESRSTGRIVLVQEGERYYIDFARLRGDSLNADLAARDFTINAMAASLTEPAQLIDPMGGRGDLKARLLRRCSPTGLLDDPVRPLRAIRLAAQLDLRVERATREAARQAASLLPSVSAERVRDEFAKMLGGRRPAASLRALRSLGLLSGIVPEVAALEGVTQSAPHAFDVWEHTLAVVERLDGLLSVLGRVHDVDAASEFALGLASVRLGRFRAEISDHLEGELGGGRPGRWLLFFAALLHDVAKPQTRSLDAPTGRIRYLGHEQAGAEVARVRGSALRLANEEIERVAVIVANHMRPGQLARGGEVTTRAAYRFFKATGAAGIDVCLLSLADLLGKGGVELDQDEWARRVDAVSILLRAYFEQAGQVVRPAPLISGRDVIDLLGVSEGPQVGTLLEAVREAQAAGQVSTREQALEFARDLAAGGAIGADDEPD